MMTKRYASYKNSGVEWIGHVPSHWQTSQLRRLGNLYGGLTGKKGDDFRSDDNPNNKPFIPYTNIANNTYISRDHFHQVVVEESENQNRVQKFDMFFLMSSETYEDLGKPCILIEDVDELYLNSFCKGFRINDEKVYPLFLNYQLLNDIHKKMISIEGQGFTRINLRQDRLKETPILIPPLSEQQQIVSYLDEKTSLIDTLIQSKQKKIALLKEKRTALINQVVTKGLNPDVEMKDSGVEWIGEIPVDWSVVTGTVLGSYSKGKGIKKDEIVSNGFPCIRYGEIYTSYEHTVHKTVSYIKEEVTKSSVSIEKGTLLLTGSGETKEDIGKCIVWLGDERVWVSGDIITVKPYDNSNPEYLSYTINSECIRIQREIFARGDIIVHIYPKNFKEMKFPLPPLSEQHQIVKYLDKETSLIDKTVSNEERKIELLKEYKQSLISEVVTGKRKVISDE